MDIGVLLKVLWPYLAALYVLDCILVVRGGHLLLTGAPLKDFRIKGSGLRMAGLLPWDWSVLSFKDPLILSEKGLYVPINPFPDDPRPPGPENLEFLPWERIGEVKRDGRRLIVNESVIHTAPTSVAAGLLAARIRTVLSAPPDYRQKSVESVLTGASDLKAIGEAVKVAKRSSVHLLYACVLLFILVFLSIPVLLLVRVPLSWLLGDALLVLVVCLVVLTLWWRTHRALLPAEQGDRVEELLVFTVFPVSLPHAFGKLTRRLFTPFDGVALATALAPDRAGELLKKEFIWNQVAAQSSVGGDLAKVWNTRIEILEKLAREISVDLTRADEWVKKPGEEETPVCPLCSATYQEGITDCADCGVPLSMAPSEPERL